MRAIIVLGLVLVSIPAHSLRIAERGRPAVVIVSQPGASAAEKRAAADLAATLTQITGAAFETKREIGENESAIIVGPGDSAKRFFPEIDLGSFGGEELVMRVRGSRLLLAGGRPRGTLYAVYKFLQDKCGVRWWTPWAARIPRNPSLAVGSLNVRESQHDVRAGFAGIGAVKRACPVLLGSR